MSQAPIYFQFADAAAADLALDTLTELGYHAHVTDKEGKPAVQLYLEQNDLTSALEIAQANGGVLLDTDRSATAADTYRSAYGLDSVPIPAHVVNEDWPESYFSSNEAVSANAAAIPASGSDSDTFDPSGDDYDHFSAGVRL